MKRTLRTYWPSILLAVITAWMVSAWFFPVIAANNNGFLILPPTPVANRVPVTQSTTNGDVLFVQVPNAALVNSSTTVNGQTCTLGSTCTVTAAPSGAAGGDLSGTYPNPTVVKFTSPTAGANPNGISITATAGSTGVTQNLLAAKDASNPTLYVVASSGGCGSGFAATTATSGNPFELYVVPGLILTGVADNAITAGHILVGGTTTPGRVKDSGQTSRTAIASGTCIVGVANANATAGNTVALRYDGVGTFGQISQHSVTFVIDGGGAVISTGDIKTYPTAAYACTINRIDISADQSGSITVDVWKAAGSIPTAANKISATAPLTLASAQLAQNGSLTGWTTAVASGDVFGFSVATVATVTRVIGQIWCQ